MIDVDAIKAKSTKVVYSYGAFGEPRFAKKLDVDLFAKNLIEACRLEFSPKETDQTIQDTWYEP